MKKALLSVHLLTALFLSACWLALPQASHALNVAQFKGTMQFNDGSPVGHIYMQKDVSASALSGEGGGRLSRLQTDINSDGSYSLVFDKPGRYELRVWGNPVSEFEVKEDGTGLSVSGLSPTIKLPYDYAIKIRPQNQTIETVDPKTGQKKNKTVTGEFSALPEIQVVNPADGAIAAILPAGQSLIVPIPAQYATPHEYVFAVIAEGYAPALIALKEIPADKRDKMNYRLIETGPRLPQNKDIHNVVTRTYYWIEQVAVNAKGDKSPWLVSYSEKKQKGAAFPLLIKEVKSTTYSPELFLDENGKLMVRLQLPDPSSSSGRMNKIFQLQGDRIWVAASYPYPRFKFKGRLFHNERWIVPNYQGIPLPAGDIKIRTVGTVEVCSECRKGRVNCGQREVKGEHTLVVRFDEETGKIDFDPPDGQCTGTIPGGADEDNRWCADPDFAPLDKSLQSQNESIKKQLEAKVKAGQKITDDTITGIGRSGLIEGYAWINEEGPLNYVGKMTVFLGFDSDGKPEIMKKDDGTPVYKEYSGLGTASESISLIWPTEDGYASPRLLNMKEGPYPELRYEAKKNNEKTVVKVYPWNYTWNINDGKVVVDRSSLFKPGDPNQDSDGDGVPDLTDLCPATPANTAVNEQGCPLADYLAVLSPDADQEINLTAGSPQDIKINVEYALDTAASGVIRATAETARRKVITKNFSVRRGGKTLDIAFPVTLAADEPIMSVSLQLIPAGHSTGPEKIVRYRGILGAFTVNVEYEGAIAAHPKNRKKITLTINAPDGKPVREREFTVLSRALAASYLEGGWLEAEGRSSVEVKTDQDGKTAVVYIPPLVLKDKIGKMTDPSVFFPAGHQLEIRDRANTEQKTIVEIPLESPYPRITKFAVPGGDLAGTWQKNPSTVVIDDADSQTFAIRLWGKGEFGYAGGHGYDEELEVENAASPFEFRFRSEEMGLDLNDLPDVLTEFGKTNAKMFIRYATLFGGKKLLKALWVKGAKAQQFIKTAEGAEIPYTIENAAKFKDKGFFVVSKMITPDGSWAANTVDVGDYILGAQKNVIEGADTYANLVSDQKIAGREETGTESTDVMLDGVHTTIGFLDTYQSFADLVNGAPMDPYSEALKIIYENAKTFYNLHRQFEDVAESWEDVFFMPILVEVEDDEGHAVRRMAKYAVKFSRKAGE